MPSFPNLSITIYQGYIEYRMIDITTNSYTFFIISMYIIVLFICGFTLISIVIAWQNLNVKKKI